MKEIRVIKRRQPPPYPVTFDNWQRLKDERAELREGRGFLGLDLYWAVIKGLSQNHKEQLRLYVAIGMAIDAEHGVDLFFSCHDNRRVAMVTLDLSLQYKPAEEFEADFNITEKEFEVGIINEIGKKIALSLEKQLGQKQKV